MTTSESQVSLSDRYPLTIEHSQATFRPSTSDKKVASISSASSSMSELDAAVAPWWLASIITTQRRTRPDPTRLRLELAYPKLIFEDKIIPRGKSNGIYYPKRISICHYGRQTVCVLMWWQVCVPMYACQAVYPHCSATEYDIWDMMYADATLCSWLPI